MPKNFDPITKFLMKYNFYEKKERSLIDFMDNDTDIIEAGAGIGLISMYLKKKIGKNKLIMIEPNEEMNDIIINNFKLNNFNEKEIIVYSKLWSERRRKDKCTISKI